MECDGGTQMECPVPACMAHCSQFAHYDKIPGARVGHEPRVMVGAQPQLLWIVLFDTGGVPLHELSPVPYDLALTQSGIDATRWAQCALLRWQGDTRAMRGCDRRLLGTSGAVAERKMKGGMSVFTLCPETFARFQEIVELYVRVDVLGAIAKTREFTVGFVESIVGTV